MRRAMVAHMFLHGFGPTRKPWKVNQGTLAHSCSKIIGGTRLLRCRSGQKIKLATAVIAITIARMKIIITCNKKSLC